MIGTESTEVPTVTITITLPGGHLMQTNDTAKVGLSGLFASMMNEDTKNYTAEQMAVELQKLGSNVTAGSGVDGFTFSIQAVSEDCVIGVEIERQLSSQCSIPIPQPCALALSIVPLPLCA